VTSGQADFEHILVYDVSRWGRFQDIDESAHYEFLCKQRGIKVAYCAEQFDNDGSLLSNIIKNIKRVMAAEYSRELGVKVHAGQSRIASLGYRVGGPIGFALYRELVDETHQSRGRLTKGQHKALKTDRVRVRLGLENETSVVRWIFEQFVAEHLSYTEIARRLNQAQVPTGDGGAWSDGRVRTILANENYAGNLVYNRTSRKLGQKQVANPADQWVRCDGVIDPIITAEMFARARKMMSERRLEIPEDEMLRRLRLMLHRTGTLSSSLIDKTPGMPSVSALVTHFGSLRAAFDRIGYVTKRDCDWIDTRETWAEVARKHAVYVAEMLVSNGANASNVAAVEHTVQVDGKASVAFMVARQAKKRQAGHATYWRVYRTKKVAADVLAVLRLNAANREIADCVLLPASAMTKRYLRLSSGMHLPPHAVRLKTVGEMADVLAARIAKKVAAKGRR
jgi:DNA invertase Pin-like site-specific DNA recombinase